MTNLQRLKARLMEDPEFRERYARIDGGYALIEAPVCARAKAQRWPTTVDGNAPSGSWNMGGLVGAVEIG